MSLFENYYYRLNTFFLKCTGLWPYQTTAKKRLIRIIFFPIMISNVVFMLFHIIKYWEDMDETLEALPSLFLIISAICKSAICVHNEEKLKKLLECIKRDWQMWSSGSEFKILRTYAESGKFLSVLFPGDIYATIFFSIAMSLSPIMLDKMMPLEEARPRLMIYPVEMFIDQDKYFTWIFIHGVITGLITLTYTVACESMYAVNTQHACGLFAIVGHRYRNAIEEVEIVKNDEDQARIDSLYEYITFSIERHTYAIEFVNTLEACYSPFLFSAMTFNMLETSITLLQTLLALGNMNKTIKYATFSLGVITHMFLVSLPAQRLVDHSTAVGEDLYNGKWYLLPLKIKKFYKIIIMQARTPCTLTAFGFYSVNFVTFSSILKSSFSYFTLFSSLRN